MEDSAALPPLVLRFGVFELDCQAGELRKSGVLVHLPPQPFKILALLAGHSGEIVSRDEIHRKIWGDETFVDFERGLNQCIRQIRAALGDDAETPRCIETLPRRGYRFIAPVKAVGSPVEAVREPLPFKRWIIGAVGGAAVILGLLVALNVLGLRNRLIGGTTPPVIHSIAVLPLVNVSGNPGQNYLAEGMTDELITTLGQVKALRVISRTSVMRFKNTRDPISQIARELNVDGIVEGSVERSDNRVRITANLIDAATDRHLWAETYERDLGNVLTLEGQVARAIVAQVRVKVTPQEDARLASARPVDAEAQRLYMKGLSFYSKNTPEGNLRAIGYFQRAVEIDPHDASAYATLANAYIAFNLNEGPPKEMYPKGIAAARKALEIDPSSARAHAVLARAYFEYDWDWAAAVKQYKRALELNPNSSSVRWKYSVYLSAMKRFAAAIREAQQAQRLNPLSRWTHRSLAIRYIYAREFDKALRQCQDTASLFPDYSGIYQDIEVIYIAQHRFQDAVAAREKSYSLEGRPLAQVAGLGQAYARNGVRGYWLWRLQRLRERAKHGYVPASSFAYVYAGLGDKDKAFFYMAKAYKAHDPRFGVLQVSPGWDPLRSDPRFQVYLRRMNFPK